jgi:hypothetical protein
MKSLWPLIIILVALLGGMSIIVEAPPFVETPIRVLLGLGFAGVMAVVLAGPIGRALGDHIRGSSLQPGDPQILARLDELSQDLQLTREEIGQLHERLDFAERLLTKQAEPARLPVKE